MPRITILLLAAFAAVAIAGCSPATEPQPAGEVPDGWGAEDTWVKPATGTLDPADYVAGVDNAYWPLAPGSSWEYEASTEEGTETIRVEVLSEMRTVSGIPCVVVRDTVKLDGELIEDTYDWYAQDVDGNVWYMGEEVDNYQNGELTDHAGSWEAGADGALPGIKVWAVPRVGQAPYYQEFYEGEAEDLGRDLRTDASASVPFGDFTDVLVVEEWTPLEPEVVERKYYARGVGTVKEEMVRGGDEVVVLVAIGKP